MTENHDPDYCLLSDACDIACADRRTMMKWIECKIVKAVKRPDGRILIEKNSLLRALEPILN